jgi:Zn-dependent metalloprotease
MATFRIRDLMGTVRPAAKAEQPAQDDLIWCLPAAIALGLAAPLAGCAVPVADDAGPPAAEGEPAPAVVPYWNALIAHTGVTPAVRWGERGTPLSLFGELSAPRGSLAGDGARGFLAENARLFQITDLGDLDEQSVVDSLIGTHVTFVQRFEGVLVHGAELKVQFASDGRIIAVNNTSVPGLAVDTRPRISAERALAVALGEVAAAKLVDVDSPTAPELVIRAEPGETAALAYRVVVPTSGPTLEFFVSAASGALLASPVDLNRYVNGTGQVFKDNAVVATHNNDLVDSNDSASAVPATAYSTVTLQGLNGNNRLDGQFASGSASRTRAVGTNNSFIFLRNSSSFSETMAYFHIDAAQRYIQSLGFTNVNNRQQVFSIDRLTSENVFYTPIIRLITYGTGGVDDAEDGEIIVHEYGHSVQDNQVPGFGAVEEGGAMGEGFGDYLGATVNATIAGDFQITCIAEWDATSYAAGVPHCLRRLDSTKHYPGDKDGEVHDDGEMWSASLFQIRTALGATRADKLIIQAHFLLSRRATFRDGANALITAAINLGYTTAEVSTVSTVLINRGFGPTA